MNLSIIQGDITKVHTDVIVNAANVAMRGGGGVDGAIHAAAGPGLDAYEAWMYPNGLSGVSCPAVTPAFELPAKHIVHVAGPDCRDFVNVKTPSPYAWHYADMNLWNAYARSIVLAGLLGAKTVTVPSLSTGIFAFPLARAVPIALDALREGTLRAPGVDTVAIVAFDTATFEAFREGLKHLGR